MNDQTVICAIATAPGMGAIAVIRLSGKGCIEICDRVFVSPSGKKLTDVRPNTIHFGKLNDGKELIDEVLISCSPFFYRGRLDRNFLSRFRVHTATYITAINLFRGTACRSRGIYSTSFFKRQNGSFPSGSRCRSDRLILRSSP